MRARIEDFGLYVITDSRLTRKGAVEDAKSAIRGGARIIQYREKDACASTMVDQCIQIKKLCKNNGVIFIVNDRIDVALAADADGVHIGQEDIPYLHARRLIGDGKIIGMSANSAKDALHNEKLGADYTSIGPIYSTKTKKDAKNPIGLEPIKHLSKILKIPLVAIGGINSSNINDVLNSGARNIAMISAIIGSENVESCVRSYMKNFYFLK